MFEDRKKIQAKKLIKKAFPKIIKQFNKVIKDQKKIVEKCEDDIVVLKYIMEETL